MDVQNTEIRLSPYPSSFMLQSPSITATPNVQDYQASGHRTFQDKDPHATISQDNCVVNGYTSTYGDPAHQNSNSSSSHNSERMC